MGKDSPNHDRTKKIKILPAKLLACWLLRQISNFQYLAQFKILPGGFFRQNFEFQDSSGKILSAELENSRLYEKNLEIKILQLTVK